MPAGIEVRGGEEIGKRVVVSPHDKRLVNEILFKVVCNGPLKGKELGLAQVIVPLSLSQRSAPISNGMQLSPSWSRTAPNPLEDASVSSMKGFE